MTFSKILKYFLVVLILKYFVLSFSIAQTREVEYYSKNYYLKEGLSQSYVTDIIQDSDDFLWIATQDGLNRFDGYSFNIYQRKKNLRNLAHLSSRKLFVDSQNVLWVGTDYGLSKYDYKKDFFEKYINKKNNFIYDIAELDANQLLLVSKKNLLLFNNQSSEFSSVLKTEFDINCVVTSNDKVLLGTNKGLLVGEINKNNKFVQLDNYLSFNDFQIKTILKISEDRYLIGTKNGLIDYSLKQNKYILINISTSENMLKNNEINTLFKDSFGVIWIGTNGGGVNKYFYSQNKIENVKLTDPRLKFISKIFEDKSGVVWIGTFDYGLFKIEPKNNFFTFNTTFNDKKIELTRVFPIYESRNKNLLIGTYGQGLVVTTNEGKVLRQYLTSNTRINSNDITCIIEDPKNENLFYVGTKNSGVNIIDYEKNIITYLQFKETDANSLPSNDIYAFCFDNDDNLWIGTENGIAILDPSRTIKKILRNIPSDKNSLSANYCRFLYKDIDGNIYISIWGYGLNKYDYKTKKIERIFDRAGENDPIYYINSIYNYNDFLWMGTYGGGLIKYNLKDNNYTIYTEEDGLSNENCYNVLQDNNNYLWISTNRGLSRFNILTEEFLNYYEEDGLENDEFNDGAALKASNGKLFFGGVGINYFDPENLDNFSYEPKVEISKVSLSDKNKNIQNFYNYLDEIQIHNNNDFIDIEFVALNYRQNEKNRYAYKIKGMHEDWINLGNKRNIIFTGLPPGEHILAIRGSNHLGEWSSKEKILKIIVLPEFWQTIYFKVIVGIILFLIVLAFYKYRVALIKKQKLNLETIVKERTAELDAINNALKDEIEERRVIEEELARYIEEIQESKDQMEKSAYDLIEINLKVEESEEKLKELNAQKDRFFSIISHDLKSPFVALLGYTEIMVEDFETLTKAEIKEFITTIYRSSKNVYNLLENLLEWSRIQTGRIDYAPEYYNLYETVNSVLDLLSENAKKKTIKLLNTINESQIVYGDENMINTVFRNLISNAIKFTKDNGMIEVFSTIDENFITVGVKDDGIGMSESDTEKLFRIDVHHTTIGTNKEKGTGVGLILCKELVEKNNGKIWVESEIGKGTTFYFTLSLRPMEGN